MTFPECGLLSSSGVLQSELFERLHPDGRELVTGWATRAMKRPRRQTPASHFEAFIYLWFAVNGWGACVAGTDKDWEWVDAVAGDPDLSATFQNLLHRDQDFRETAQAFAALWPIFNSSEIRRRGVRIRGDSSRAQRVQAYFDEGLRGFQPSCWHAHEGRPPLDWAHNFKTVYRVRCNLFHGEKTLDSENDRDIVRAAYNVLASFVRKAELLGQAPGVLVRDRSIAQDQQLPITRAIGTVRLASEFASVATLEDVDRSPPSMVTYFLLGHSLELAFKAILIAHGISARTLRDLGHDLTAVAQAATEVLPPGVLPLDVSDRARLEVLAPFYRKKHFEYLVV